MAYRNPWMLEPDVFFRLLPQFLGTADRRTLRLVVQHQVRRADWMWVRVCDPERPIGIRDYTVERLQPFNQCVLYRRRPVTMPWRPTPPTSFAVHPMES